MGYSQISSDKYYARWVSEQVGALTDDDIKFSQELLQRAGFEETTFFDRPVPVPVSEYLQWAKSEDKLFFVLYTKDGTPLGIVWFNNPSLTGAQWYIHFATLGTTPIHDCAEAGRALIEHMGRTTKLRQAIGITPLIYRHAIRFIKQVGLQPVAILQNGVHCLGKDRDALLTIYTIKETVNGRSTD